MARRPKTRLEDYDAVRDRVFIDAEARAEALAVIEGIAAVNAMAAHPISRYVKEVPAERSDRYPAISENYHSFHKRIFGRKAKAETRRNSDLIDYGVPNVIWSLPGQSESDGCGVRRSPSGRIPVKVCSDNPKDFLKAVSNHCGRLKCAKCMNLTALQTGVKIEDRICTPADIRGRFSGDYARPKHWVVSPPQEWIKMICQNSRSFSALVDDLISLLPAYGFDCGVIVFHPWRLNEKGDLWEFSPHFHVVGFGFFNNEQLRKDLESLPEFSGGQHWVFNQIHSGEEIRSVRHTLSYILTHAGIGNYQYDKDVFDIVDDLTMPPEARNGGSVEKVRTIPRFEYETKGAEECRYYGEIPEDFDWLSFIKDSMTATLPVYRYFGSVNKLRIVARHSEYVQRRCPECGADIVLKNDFSQCECEPVRYLRRSTVRCFKDDIDLIRGYLAEHGSVFNSQGHSILDFGMSVPQCSTPETKGLQEYESDKTVEQRRAQRDKCIIYIPSKRYGQGLDPVVISKSDLRTKRKELEEKYPEADIFSFIEV